jgi:hypothetical protein
MRSRLILGLLLASLVLASLAGGPVAEAGTVVLWASDTVQTGGDTLVASSLFPAESVLDRPAYWVLFRVRWIATLGSGTARVAIRPLAAEWDTTVVYGAPSASWDYSWAAASDSVVVLTSSPDAWVWEGYARR